MWYVHWYNRGGMEGQRDNELDIMRVKWEEMRKNKVGVFCVPSTLKCFYLIINPVMTIILPFAKRLGFRHSSDEE